MKKNWDFGLRNRDSRFARRIATTAHQGFQVPGPKSQVLNLLLRIGLFLLLAVVTLSAVTDADTHFNNLGHRLMCTCGCGQVLMECNHVGCQSSERMRAELKTAMGRGGGDDQALNWFVQNYGPVVLAAPGKTGFDRVAWVMPYLVLGLGLTLTGSVVHMWRSRTKAVPGGSSPEARPEVIADLRRRIHEDTEI